MGPTDDRERSRSVPPGAQGLIRFEGLHKSFKGMPVLRGVDLDVPPGCLYGLIGPGASGKSVMLKLVAGLLRPDGGRVLVEGRDVHAMTELELATFRLKFGMLFQNNALFDYLTVGESLQFSGMLRGLSRARVKQESHSLLVSLGLEDKIDAMVDELSGGMKRKLCLALAFLGDSKV